MDRKREKEGGRMHYFMKKEDRSLLEVENVETTGERCCHLTDTIEQFIVYVHRNEAHFTYVCIWGWQHLQKPSLKCHFTYIFCYFYFALGLHPWLRWLLECSQIPSCPRQLQKCARLMQGWVASAGCLPNKNPGYAGVTEINFLIIYLLSYLYLSMYLLKHFIFYWSTRVHTFYVLL